MTKVTFCCTIFLATILFRPVLAQKNVRDSCVSMGIASFGYMAQLPGADLADRFGFSNSLAIYGGYKLDNNWSFGLSYHFQFGSLVQENDMLDDMRTSEGFILNSNGLPANVLLFQRGHVGQAHIGKLFPWIGPNPNAGVLFRFGMGYWTHRIRIEHINDAIPQLEGEYKKGYDRMAGGMILSQFIGYQHTSNNRLINFYAGFEFWQGIMQPLRSYQYDLMGPEEGSRFDLNFGIKAGWILPIYKRPPPEYMFD